MASIQKRINKSGKIVWRVFIRRKGFNHMHTHFDSEMEAIDFSIAIEQEMERCIARKLKEKFLKQIQNLEKV